MAAAAARQPLSESYTEALPDFVKLAEAYGAHGFRCEKPGELDATIDAMIATKGPVIVDCRVRRSPTASR